jgi:hypothetical protein
VPSRMPRSLDGEITGPPTCSQLSRRSVIARDDLVDSGDAPWDTQPWRDDLSATVRTFGAADD